MYLFSAHNISFFVLFCPSEVNYLWFFVSCLPKSGHAEWANAWSNLFHSINRSPETSSPYVVTPCPIIQGEDWHFSFHSLPHHASKRHFVLVLFAYSDSRVLLAIKVTNFWGWLAYETECGLSESVTRFTCKFSHSPRDFFEFSAKIRCLLSFVDKFWSRGTQALIRRALSSPRTPKMICILPFSLICHLRFAVGRWRWSNFRSQRQNKHASW